MFKSCTCQTVAKDFVPPCKAKLSKAKHAVRKTVETDKGEEEERVEERKNETKRER